MGTYVLVHGAWHTGDLLEPTAAPIRAAGHRVFLPTLAGNRPGDSKQVGLEDAIKSLTDYFVQNEIKDAVVMGHSYGGMVITALADRMPERVRRLIYWNAFVPDNGESLNDLCPPMYPQLFAQLAQPDGSVMLPFPIWREGFVNDADLATAEAAYAKLNAHPIKTFSDPIKLTKNPAAMMVGKSYLNCTEDIAMPHAFPWHPRLSSKLGLFRLVQTPGSHELCFSNPAQLGAKLIEAGRD
jgi:pimeloyl-ACP methyl ester carboxylesterase